MKLDVLAVRGQDLVADRVDGEERRDPDEDQRRHERDHERDSRQHLVAEAAVEPEHALDRVPPDRDERPDGSAARAVVGAVADVVDARALRRSRARLHVDVLERLALGPEPTDADAEVGDGIPDGVVHARPPRRR